MANSRDFTGKNRKFTGTKGIITPKGTTGQRVGGESGELRFNTTTELMEYYDGTGWKPIDAPPSILSFTTSDTVGTSTILNADGSTLYTITINGGNFSVGATVKFIGNTGTEYAAGNINRVSNSQITCTTLSNMGTTDDPYDITVTNTSSLFATFNDAFSYNAPPVFVNASGVIGEVFNGRVVSGSTFNASATDAEGNTITYSLISGSFPGSGLTLSSSTGLITGTVSGAPSLGNYPFVIRAATTEGFVERQFSLQVIAPPFVAATGGTETSSGDYKIHTFTGPGTFTVTNAGGPLGSNEVDYLVVAGGGAGGQGKAANGGGSGGGAGGFRESKATVAPWTASPLATPTSLPVSATSYPITVGGGGGPGSGEGTPGNNSIFSTITSAGGGGGGGGQSPDSGQPGGSGAARGKLGNSPPTSPPQGQNGGPSTGGASSGGGGAGEIGAAAPPGSNYGVGGRGGAGVSSSISGSPVAYAGGGGGGGYAGGGQPSSAGGAGSPCGTGGRGNPVASGTTNRGGAGGGNEAGDGSSNAPHGSGGSGIVIIRYKYQ